MTVYRIIHTKYAEHLIASGLSNRWNLSGQFVIYTSTSKALACLENLVYASGETLRSGLYRCLEIFIPDTVTITTILLKELPDNFNNEELRALTQKIGNNWYTQNKHLLLKVPSAIIPSENNVIINSKHDDFKKVKINKTEKFVFDKRLKK